MMAPGGTKSSRPRTAMGHGNDNSDNTYAAIYCRTSSPNQKDNYSIGGQLAQCLDYCKQRGWIVSRIFVDECLDGKSIDHRPKFQLMIKKAKSGEFDVVIGWKLDRLCRSLSDLVNVERTLRTHGVQLCSVTELIDTATSYGRFSFRGLANYAELESEIIGERSRLGLYGLAREGKWPNGLPPIGYDRDNDGRLRIIHVEARTVRWIFRTYLKQKSLDHVAFMLNAKRVPTKRGDEKVWTKRAVRDILTNTIYIGQFNVAGHVEELDELRIVDYKVFNKANRMMHRYSIKHSKRPPMPLQRKQAKVHKIMARYEEFLGSMA